MKRLPDVALLLAAVCAVAYFAPAPNWPTDRDVYQGVAREWVVEECDELHCFRPLVPWLLGRIPGEPLVAWKTFAAICQVIAGLLMAAWAARWGASRTAARQVAWLTALGSGACYTLFDPHTPDPLMHALAPGLMLLIDRGRHSTAMAVSMIGVLAKEFAAVPLVLSAAWRASTRRYREAFDLGLRAAAVFALWVTWQVFARQALYYTTGDSRTGLLTDSYLALWLSNLTPALVASVVAMVFGGAWLIWLAGIVAAPPEFRKLLLTSLPIVAVFNVVQQPDRALWNFAFLVMPIVALMLSRVPAVWGWLFVAAQLSLNVRFGAQLTFVPTARWSFAAAVVLAGLIVVLARRPASIARPIPI